MNFLTPYVSPAALSCRFIPVRGVVWISVIEEGGRSTAPIDIDPARGTHEPGRGVEARPAGLMAHIIKA